MNAMISSDIQKKSPNITAEDVKDVGGKIEDKAAEGRRGTELQSSPPEKPKEGTKNMEGAGPGGAGMA
jgi:hypothetical protein